MIVVILAPLAASRLPILDDLGRQGRQNISDRLTPSLAIMELVTSGAADHDVNFMIDESGGVS